MRISRSIFVVLVSAILLTGCKPKDYEKLPAFSKRNHLQAVIEIPAGTNLNVFYCTLDHRFKIEMTDGAERKIEFLPYPANFGFIPSTRLENETGESNDMLDVVVISEQLSTGTIIEILPLGLLILKDDFKIDYKIIAIPVNPEYQVVNASSLHDLEIKYPGMTVIIQEWFVNSHMYHNANVLGWEDEHVVKQLIEKWLVKKSRQFNQL